MKSWIVVGFMAVVLAGCEAPKVESADHYARELIGPKPDEKKSSPSRQYSGTPVVGDEAVERYHTGCDAVRKALSPEDVSFPGPESGHYMVERLQDEGFVVRGVVERTAGRIEWTAVLRYGEGEAVDVRYVEVGQKVLLDQE
ncbi:MAG: hypothetical protein ACYTGV_18055 [Planctomycetota bacterium]